MHSWTDDTGRSPDTGDTGAVQRRLAEIEGSLLGQLTNERRYGSGVPGQEQASDLEFIQMTGLTRPFSVPADNSAPRRAAPPSVSELHGSMDFYEHDVPEVHGGTSPTGPKPSRESRPSSGEAAHEEEPQFVLPESKSADALRELIADLTRDGEDSDEDASVTQAPIEAAPLPAAAESFAFSRVTPEGESLPESVEPCAGDWDLPAGAPALDITAFDQPPEVPVPPSSGVSLETLLEEALTARVEAEQAHDAAARREAQVDWEAPDSDVASPIQRHAVPPPGGDVFSRPGAPENRLAEAEELLQQLEHQPRMASASSRRERDDIPESTERNGDADQGEYYPDISRKRTSQRRVYRRSRRRLLRRIAAALCVVAAAAAAYYVYRLYIAPLTLSPASLAAEARERMDEAAYREAASLWSTFAQRFPSNPDAGQAQFMAGFSCYLARPLNDDDGRDLARRALIYFDEFIGENPGHPKIPRARCMMGILHFRMQQYDKAIEMLQPLCESGPHAEDGEILLPAMRTLARAHARLGQYVAAEEMYEAAASLEDNLTPEVDYFELGNLYAERTGSAANAVERRTLRAKAIAYLENALRAPGIDPQERERIRVQKGLLDEEAAGDAGPPGADTMQPAVPTEKPTDAAAAPVPESGAAEPNPALEAVQLQPPQPGTS